MSLNAIPDDATEETTREAAAVFPSAEALQAAVDGLLDAGFPRAALSVLGGEKALREKYGVDIPDAAELAARTDAPRGNFVSSDARTEGLAALAGVPVYVGGAGAAAIAAIEGATIVATAGAALGVGVVAGALGLYAVRRMEKRHAQEIDRQLEHGGLVLWTRLDDEELEPKALDILRQAGGKDISVHTVTLARDDVNAVPFHDVQPDPFLERG